MNEIKEEAIYSLEYYGTYLDDQTIIFYFDLPTNSHLNADIMMYFNK